MPFFLWPRLIVAQQIVHLHRHRLGTAKRDAARESSPFENPFQEASSVQLAAHLVGQLSSPSDAPIRDEKRMLIQQPLPPPQGGGEPIQVKVELTPE